MLPSGLPDIVGEEEPLARFLTSSSHFNATNVKATAFLPNPKAAMTTSVFRHAAEPREELIHLTEWLGSGVSVHGAAICKAAAVYGARLDVVPEEPPPLHANVVGWPGSLTDAALRKALQIEQAQVIAEACALIRFETRVP